MANAIGDLSIGDLQKLVKSVAKSFDSRDDLYENRRKVRFRLMEKELKGLPLSNRAGANQALLIFQTEEPNQEVHRRVKRLVANKPRIECIIYDTDDHSKEAAQNVKDALKALWKWMNRAKTPPDRISTGYQQGDGIGWLKLDFIPSFADDALAPFDVEYLTMSEEEFGAMTLPDEYGKARQDFSTLRDKLLTKDPGDAEASATAYSVVTDHALRKCDPPFRLSAPDPVTIVFERDGDSIILVIEKGKRKVSALLDAYKDAGLRLVNNRLVMPTGSEPIDAATIPENQTLSGEYGDLCEYIEIRTKNEIVILMRNPQLAKGARSRGKVEDDYVKIKFENPFGPYSTGYVMVPGDMTGSSDPAHEFQPPILGTLSLAQPLNVLETARLSAALDKALAGKYIKSPDAQPAPTMNAQQTDKTANVKDGKPVPVIPGEVKREESANIDLDKSEQMLNGMMAGYRFNEVLAGDAQSSDSGHKLAIQVSQADTQLVPYQNARAEAIAEILMCCLYAVKKAGQSVYVKEVPEQDAITMNKFERVQPVRCITPEMFDLDFNLVVTIGSETPVTKFAKWSAMEQRYKAGTLSFETLMEQSDVENVRDETARIFEGQTLTAVMQQAIPVVVQMIAARAIAKLQGQPAEGGVAGAGPGPGDASQVIGEGGNANGGGMPGAQASTPIAGVGRVPGVGLSAAGPTVAEEGPRVHEGAGDGQTGIG